jgi:hypothetical protein
VARASGTTVAASDADAGALKVDCASAISSDALSQALGEPVTFNKQQAPVSATECYWDNAKGGLAILVHIDGWTSVRDATDQFQGTFSDGHDVTPISGLADRAGVCLSSCSGLGNGGAVIGKVGVYTKASTGAFGSSAQDKAQEPVLRAVVAALKPVLGG